MNTAVNNKLLAGLATYIRPLLSEAGNAMGMPSAGFIGVCFQNQPIAASNVLFAEYVNPANRKGSYEGDYILPSTCGFVRAIANATDEGRVWQYSPTSDEPPAVTKPLAIEFPSATTPQNIFTRRLGQNNECGILYFVASSQQVFEEFPRKLDTTQIFFLKALRDALFLAATANPDLQTCSDLLIARLPECFPTYTQAQKDALAKLRHPYLQWLEGPQDVPRLIGKYVPPKDVQFLSAIRGAVKVEVTELLSGSFQDHNVYSATIQPSHSGKPFDAAIKAASQSRASKEVRGYFSLLPYFRNTRDLMPSAPLIFPPVRATSDKSGNENYESLYTVMTPHLGGKSLYTFIEEQWTDHVDRVGTLRTIFSALRQFLGNIRPLSGREEYVPPYIRLYDSHLGGEQRSEGGRFNKTMRQFFAWLPSGADAGPLLKHGEDSVVNALWVLNSAPTLEDLAGIHAFWHTNVHPRRIVRYGHGDFHVGNILVTPETNRVTVLDFDYVGEHPEYEDSATLEASFVLAVAATRPFQDETKWRASWPEAVRFLSGELPLQSVENNRLCHDLARLVEVIRGTANKDLSHRYMPNEFHYHACLATALFRLFTSHSRKMDEPQFRPVGATALLWLGMLLKKLVNIKPSTTPTAINLFRSLGKPQD